MLEIQRIREHRNSIVTALNKRNLEAEPLIAQVIALDEKRRALQTELDNTLAEANKRSKEIGALFQAGKTQQANALKEKTVTLKQTAKQLGDALHTTAAALQEQLNHIPNTPHTSVPVGTSSEDNEEVFRQGTPPTLHQGALPHWELAKTYDIIDFELGVKVTGAGFPVYKGKGARLQRALIAYFLDKNTQAGYTEIQPPHLVNAASGYATAQLPDKEGQMYHVQAEDLYLIPTAEVPITNLHRGDLLAESDFPIKYTGYTPCFRRESGSYGAHVRGLNRLHQFDKVEIVRIAHPDQSYQALEEMVAHAKHLLQELKLPYRILRLCSGDLSFASAITYDFEVFSAAQNRWLEVSSISNFETFQANRLKLRFREDKSGKIRLAHTLNGSTLGMARTLAALLENYQTPEGITIPEVLVPYCGFDRID